ncbi:hypothetical protein BDV98DRAFT_630506 [Pterulicium gracile]|uniref:Uncharacterized protein n=1 Tax=Pterulicium gracile TaxID=1884261 RepID=A0A5C3QV63_9AGAR|nr:hypothetical protein BDV98DRAFT_630506 [Pterula gracilis]
MTLPQYIRVFTNAGVPFAKAMAISSKLYKIYGTPGALKRLSDLQLIQAGFQEKDERKTIMSALKKGGYRATNHTASSSSAPGARTAAAQDAASGTPAEGTSSTVQVVSTPPKKKRKRQSDVNEFLPERPKDELSEFGSLDFGEVMDEATLLTKSTHVNRAPLMTAWATVVGERLGFRREEALSIASVYTEMNALTKGVSLGIFESGRDAGIEARRGGSQPYVDFIGRRPLYQTQDGQWRAMLKHTPAQPGPAFAYISRAFRQTAPNMIGALRLLAESYGPEVLNQKAWCLYADFRPKVEGWGQRGEVRCDTILALRKLSSDTQVALSEECNSKSSLVKFESTDDTSVQDNSSSGDAPVQENSPPPKRKRGPTLEEYEAELDDDTTFDGVDLNADAY